MPDLRRYRTLLGLIALPACSSLPQEANGVVALDVTIPDTLALVIGDSLQLRAVARDINGDSVTADVVRWRTPDTALVTLDSLSGWVVAKSDSGSARVQASVGTLLSNVITIPLRPDTATASLRAR